MTNLKFAFFGTSDFSVFCLEEMKKLGLLPALIITSSDKPVGRKLLLQANPVKIWALENNINFLTPNNLKDLDLTSHLTPNTYNLFLVASYGKIIPEAILALPKYGTLNIHPSLLPKYRGPSPLQTQILNGDKEVGVSIMLLDEQVDHGPIITSQGISLALEGNSPASSWPLSFNQLEEKLAQAGADLFVKVLPDWLEGKIEAKEQDHNQATFTKKIEKKDGELDLVNGDPYKNYLKYLAYSESPRVYAFAGKIRFIITDAEFKDGQFIIKRVIPEGKKEMPYDDFLRGLK